MVSFNGSPAVTEGPKTPGTPMRANCRPVIKAAREPLQTGQPEYHEVRILPPYASLLMLSVFVVGWPLKPRSP